MADPVGTPVDGQTEGDYVGAEIAPGVSVFNRVRVPVTNAINESTIGTTLNPVALGVTNVATMNALGADKRSTGDRITLPKTTSNGMTYSFDGTNWVPLVAETVVVDTAAEFNALSEMEDNQRVWRLADNKRFTYDALLAAWTEDLTSGDGWTNPTTTYTWAPQAGAKETITENAGNLAVNLKGAPHQMATITAPVTLTTSGAVNDAAAVTPYTLWIDRGVTKHAVVNPLANNGNVSIPDEEKVFLTFAWIGTELVTLSAGTWG